MSQEYYDEMEFNEIDRKKKVRKKKNYPVRLLIFAGLVLAGILFLSSGFFSISEIQVEGNSYYSDDEIINMAGAQTGKNIFWGIDASDLRDALEDNPYFSEVKVKRKLPKTLTIEIEERVQIAAVTYGDQYVVIDKEGTILRKTGVNPKLTTLTGLTVSKLTVGEKLEAEESATLETTLQMLDAMADGDIFFKKIDVSRVILRAYIYDTLVVKGTAKQMMKAINSGDLQKVVNNLFENDTTRGTINLGDNNYMSFSPDF